MPLYEFECKQCGLQYEELITTQNSYATCPDCGDVLHGDDRKVSQGSFKLKGQCWSFNGYMHGEK